LSMVFSLFGFCSWLFCSPHMSHSAGSSITGPAPRPAGRSDTADEDSDLDRKLGSYYFLQLVANIIVASSGMFNCQSDDLVAKFCLGVNLLVWAMFSIIGTNLLSHRYLFEKAKTMVHK
jgi:hypothetical protein